MLLLANLFWGLSFPTIKAMTLAFERLAPGCGTWFITAMSVMPRMLMAAGVLLIFQARDLASTTAAELRQGVIMGLFAGCGMLLQNDGLQFTAASTSAFLTQFYAILIPVYLAVRSRRNPGARVWVCCLLVMAGSAILGRFDWHALRLGRGELETLASSLFFMGQILTLEAPPFRENRPERITLVLFATEALIFLVLSAATAPSAAALTLPWRSAPLLTFNALLTVFCTLGAFLLMNTWQPKITATEAGLIYCVEPIFGSAMALVLPAWFSRLAGIDYANETLAWPLLVGGGLITAANILLQLAPRPKAGGGRQA